MRVLCCFVAEMGVVRSVGAGGSPGLVRRVSGTVEGTGPRGSRGEDFGITGGVRVQWAPYVLFPASVVPLYLSLSLVLSLSLKLLASHLV